MTRTHYFDLKVETGVVLWSPSVDVVRVREGFFCFPSVSVLVFDVITFLNE
mgnify:FL=1